MLFTFKGHHGCKVTAPGTLDSATEISGTYTSKHCNGITSGTYDMTHNRNRLLRDPDWGGAEQMIDDTNLVGEEQAEAETQAGLSR